MSIADRSNYVPVFLNFSAQTSSIRTQEMIEAKLEKKRKNILGWSAFNTRAKLCYGPVSVCLFVRLSQGSIETGRTRSFP